MFYITSYGRGILKDNFKIVKNTKTKYVINLQSRTAYNFTIKKTRTVGEGVATAIAFQYPKAKGNINFAVTNKADGEMEYVTVTTTDQVTSTDNIIFDNITINFV